MTEKAFRAIIGTWETLLFHWPRLVVLGCVGITFGGDRQFWAWLPRVVHSAHLEGMPMKNRLIYQSSEYDCGPTSVTNAIRFLFERAEIPPAVLKHIWIMGIDTFSADGEPGKEGTSKASMRYMDAWLECFAENCQFPIKTAFLDMEFATVQPGSPAWRCLERGGCVVMRCSLGGDGHYVLLTRIVSQKKVGLFDPYDEYPDPDDPAREYVFDQPKALNRIVDATILNAIDYSDYAMGPLEKRELLLFWRSDQ